MQSSEVTEPLGHPVALVLVELLWRVMIPPPIPLGMGTLLLLLPLELLLGLHMGHLIGHRQLLL